MLFGTTKKREVTFCERNWQKKEVPCMSDLCADIQKRECAIFCRHFLSMNTAKLLSEKKKTNSGLALEEEEVQRPNKPTCGGLKRRPVRIKGGRCASLRCLCTRSNSSSYRLPRVPCPPARPGKRVIPLGPRVSASTTPAGRVASRVRLFETGAGR